MNARHRFTGSLRIIWAITRKDLTEMLHNREMLAGLGAVVFVILVYQFLPNISEGDELPAVLIYDEAGTSLVAETLSASGVLDVYTYPTQSAMQERLGHGELPELGLVIPREANDTLASTQPTLVQGYHMQWISRADAQKLADTVEAIVSADLGYALRINLEGNVLYPEPDSSGKPFLVSVTLAIVVVMLGMLLTPRLFLDEKTGRTIDVLLVSPASYGQIVASKALTGMILSGTGLLVVLGMNLSIIHHWWLTLLVCLSGQLFAVAIGLLLGVLVEVKQQLQVWAMILAQPLLLPVFLVIMEDIIPTPIVAAMNLIPTTTMAHLLRVSFSNGAPLAAWVPGLVLIIGVTGAILGLVVRRVRRTDR